MVLTLNEQVEFRKLQKLVSILFVIYANNKLYRECWQITTIKFLSISSLDGYEPVQKPLRFFLYQIVKFSFVLESVIWREFMIYYNFLM